MACPVARNLGDRSHSAMIRGFVEQSVRGPAHDLRVSAIALAQDPSLRMQISTDRAVPLGLASIQHMICGTNVLTIRSSLRGASQPLATCPRRCTHC